MSKSLVESAADILNTSLKGAGKDPMVAGPGSGAQEVGGETPDSSDLENRGARAAAPVKQNPPPSAKGDPKSVKVQAMEEVEADEDVELTEEELDDYINSLTEEELAELVAEAEELDEQGMTGVTTGAPGKAATVKIKHQKGSTVPSPKMAEETELEEWLDSLSEEELSNLETLSEEQIDELSRGLLNRYKKAADQNVHYLAHQKVVDSRKYTGRVYKDRDGYDTHEYTQTNPSADDRRRIASRNDGIELANQKLSRTSRYAKIKAGGQPTISAKRQQSFKFEEVEQVNELSAEEIAEARKAAIKEMVAKNMSSCKEDVDALFNGEALSEEFRNKATTIFEAAVRARVEAITTQVVEENEQILADAVAEINEDLSNQVDEYLNYVVENWMEENELAIETGIRAEIAEDFMAGLKNLFAEHYIEVPEEKADLVEAIAEEAAIAEQALEEAHAKIAEITKALNESKATEILRKTCEGLTEMQVAKIKTLAEGVEFTTEGEYADKLAVIRESYFPSGKPAKAAAPQVVVETEEAKGTNNVMDFYVNAITKQLPK